VYIVGAANSAGQAAVHLSRYADSVTMVCRGPELSQTMSRYLIDEITSKDNIHVRNRTQVVEAHGDGQLERLTIRGPDGDETVDALGLFVMIGAEPRVDWLPQEIERDERGFVVAGPTYETSVPGVFAIGDVRAGSVKRVASAVGEGSVVIQHVHRYLESVAERASVG
jgi:thioredoxin reductase (NADPH)